MTPSGTGAIASVDGERLALETLVTFGPTPQLGGTSAVFTRTASGWAISSVKPLDSGSTVYTPQTFSPELTQLGVESSTAYPPSPGSTFQAGVPGGPFAVIAETPSEYEGKLVGANTGTVDVPPLSHVLFASTDHAVLSGKATGTGKNAEDLYVWSGGGACGSVTSNCKLVNVTGEGTQATVIGQCGATLGAGSFFNTNGIFRAEFARNAVSASGSKIFFTSPDIAGGRGEDQMRRAFICA
jgi:hypothetical protein